MDSLTPFTGARACCACACACALMLWIIQSGYFVGKFGRREPQVLWKSAPGRFNAASARVARAYREEAHCT